MYEDGIEYCNKALEIDPDNIRLAWPSDLQWKKKKTTNWHR